MLRVYEGVVQDVNSLQDQWQKKKQTKKEAAAARRGKLDPDSELNRNAKEVMDERARSKRKLREVEDDDEEDEDEDDVEEDDSYEEMEGVEAEKPGEGLKKQREESAKKQKEDTKSVETPETPADEASALSKKEQKRAAKREKKLEKKAAKKAQQPEDAPAPKKQKPNTTKEPSPVPQEDNDDTASASEPQSPTFDDAAANNANNATEAASTTTSVSSTIPPSEKPKHIKLPADTTALRARLAAKIEALRAARKADGADGKPIRTRQELIESRRAKQEQRKQHKKEVRLQAKMEEDRLREEALASNSPGIMSPAVELDENGSGFSFGRVAFSDGSQMSHDMSYILNQGKKKGPSDAKTALLKVQNAKKRLQAMDEDQRNDISEKDAWLTARRRAEGEKIRNNESILKKTIKRKEAAKKKSGKEWGDRLKGVDQAQKDRQKKREDNLKKRRDDKMLGKAGKKKKGGAKKKSGGRPGFEGSLGVGGCKKKK